MQIHVHLARRTHELQVHSDRMALGETGVTTVATGRGAKAAVNVPAK